MTDIPYLMINHKNYFYVISTTLIRAIWINTVNMTSYCLWLFLIPFHHLKENEHAIRTSEVSAEMLGEKSCKGELTHTLNSSADMFSSFAISKAFSRTSALVMGVSSFHLSATRSPVKLCKSRQLWARWKDMRFSSASFWFFAFSTL